MLRVSNFKSFHVCHGRRMHAKLAQFGDERVWIVGRRLDHDAFSCGQPINRRMRRLKRQSLPPQQASDSHQPIGALAREQQFNRSGSGVSRDACPDYVPSF